MLSYHSIKQNHAYESCNIKTPCRRNRLAFLTRHREVSKELLGSQPTFIMLCWTAHSCILYQVCDSNGERWCVRNPADGSISCLEQYAFCLPLACFNGPRELANELNYMRPSLSPVLSLFEDFITRLEPLICIHKNRYHPAR